MQLLRVITITLPHPRFPNPCFPLLCFSVFCPHPQPSDSPTPPCTDTFFIAILPDFAFTRLLFIELFPDFPGYRLNCQVFHNQMLLLKLLEEPKENGFQKKMQH
ncbi:uncharacterized protein [Gossypium hirsutum]|uniref:Uncharacterized protein isoform X4 n=1 Tax=Gossypium hirsutum TaxID=3635 RepID=A0ABM3ATY2_GOSHI|nr:uncharacterized protein LOC107947450 isoform X4 [Gossypium hirsutum]